MKPAGGMVRSGVVVWTLRVGQTVEMCASTLALKLFSSALKRIQTLPKIICPLAQLLDEGSTGRVHHRLGNLLLLLGRVSARLRVHSLSLDTHGSVASRPIRGSAGQAL
jgi:hypothetical protein